MRIKSNLMKAASIVAYVQTFLWFIACAAFFALGNYGYIAFLLFALLSLYDGFLVTNVREKMTGPELSGKEKTKYLVYTCISIVSPVSFVLNLIAYLWTSEDKYVIVPNESVLADANAKAAAKAEKKNAKKPFYKAKSFITMCAAFLLIFVCGFSAMCVETVGFAVKVSDHTLTREMTEKYGEGQVNGVSYTISDKYYYMKDGLEVDVSEANRKTDDDGASWYTEVDGKRINLTVASPTYSFTMYKPKSATAENPAPIVFVIAGFTRTKATMSQYAIELARRGAVVFTSDPGGQGGTTETSTTGANGIEYLVQYIYNAAKSGEEFEFCDYNRIGAVGHSAGGGNVSTLASASGFRGTGYADSIIKAVYISGYIKASSIGNYKNFNCNAAMSYAYYDEGAYRYQSATESLEAASLAFINNVGGEGTNNYDNVALDYGYGSMTEGTYRIMHRENINHCFEMYDNLSIANTVNFFNESLGMDSDISGTDQIWFGKEFFNGLALASAFTFIIALCAVLMMTPFFATLKNGGKKKAKAVEGVSENTVEEAEGGAQPAEAVAAPVPMQTVSGSKPAAPAAVQHKTVAHKVIFWSCMILTAIIACLDYIPLAGLSIDIFPTSNASNVYTTVFPARMINAILLWAAINGAIGLVIFFGTTLIENLYEYVMYKVKGIQPHYEWSKFADIKIRGNGWKNVVFNVLKSLLLVVVMFGSFYFLVQLSYWMFHQDFRFMLISAAPLNARMFVTALEYMPIIFVFYISNSIRVNCSIGREGWKEWKVLLVGALANSLGLAFILLINYVCFFATGAPFYTYSSSGAEVWLFVNMVFGLVVMMFILPIFNRIFYKMTGNVWVGAIACCMIFIMMTISASVSYIPMY